MPIKPQPMLIQCRQCGWQTTYAPPSDALLIPPPENCAKCGCAELDSKPASAAGVMAVLSSLLKR